MTPALEIGHGTIQTEGQHLRGVFRCGHHGNNRAQVAKIFLKLVDHFVRVILLLQFIVHGTHKFQRFRDGRHTRGSTGYFRLYHI